MGRILLHSLFVAVFCTCISGTDYTYGCDGYHRLSIGGRENLRLLSGYDLVSIDLLSGALPVTVKGREHIDRKQSYVFVANHQGAFDIFLIYGFLGVPIKWVMKAGIAKIPFVGAACRAAGFIFVDNSTPKAAARSVLEAERCLRNGASVVVFPEGSRTYTGKMIRFKKGAYQMALGQHLPIIPITLNGPFDVLPIGSLNVHRHRMEMVIHPAVSTENIDTSHKGMQAFADQTQEIIASALWEEYK